MKAWGVGLEKESKSSSNFDPTRKEEEDEKESLMKL
jgi:hypothetical protein